MRGRKNISPAVISTCEWGRGRGRVQKADRLASEGRNRSACCFGLMFSKSFLPSASLLAIAAQGIFAVSLKRATYPNPIPLAGNSSTVRDPTLCKDPSTSTYYVFSTGNGIPIRSSQDLVTWNYVGEVWPDGAPWGEQYNNASNNFWAPDCTIKDGKWMVRVAP